MPTDLKAELETALSQGVGLQAELAVAEKGLKQENGKWFINNWDKNVPEAERALARVEDEVKQNKAEIKRLEAAIRAAEEAAAAAAAAAGDEADESGPADGASPPDGTEEAAVAAAVAARAAIVAAAARAATVVYAVERAQEALAAAASAAADVDAPGKGKPTPTAKEIAQGLSEAKKARTSAKEALDALNALDVIAVPEAAAAAPEDEAPVSVENDAITKAIAAGVKIATGATAILTYIAEAGGRCRLSEDALKVAADTAATAAAAILKCTADAADGTAAGDGDALNAAADTADTAADAVEDIRAEINKAALKEKSVHEKIEELLTNLWAVYDPSRRSEKNIFGKTYGEKLHEQMSPAARTAAAWQAHQGIDSSYRKGDEKKSFEDHKKEINEKLLDKFFTPDAYARDSEQIFEDGFDPGTSKRKQEAIKSVLGEEGGRRLRTEQLTKSSSGKNQAYAVALAVVNEDYALEENTSHSKERLKVTGAAVAAEATLKSDLEGLMNSGYSDLRKSNYSSEIEKLEAALGAAKGEAKGKRTAAASLEAEAAPVDEAIDDASEALAKGKSAKDDIINARRKLLTKLHEDYKPNLLNRLSNSITLKKEMAPWRISKKAYKEYHPGDSGAASVEEYRQEIEEELLKRFLTNPGKQKQAALKKAMKGPDDVDEVLSWNKLQLGSLNIASLFLRKHKDKLKKLKVTSPVELPRNDDDNITKSNNIRNAVNILHEQSHLTPTPVSPSKISKQVYTNNKSPSYKNSDYDEACKDQLRDFMCKAWNERRIHRCRHALSVGVEEGGDNPLALDCFRTPSYDALKSAYGPEQAENMLDVVGKIRGGGSHLVIADIEKGIYSPTKGQPKPSWSYGADFQMAMEIANDKEASYPQVDLFTLSANDKKLFQQNTIAGLKLHSDGGDVAEIAKKLNDKGIGYMRRNPDDKNGPHVICGLEQLNNLSEEDQAILEAELFKVVQVEGEGEGDPEKKQRAQDRAHDIVTKLKEQAKNQNVHELVRAVWHKSDDKEKCRLDPTKIKKRAIAKQEMEKEAWSKVIIKAMEREQLNETEEALLAKTREAGIDIKRLCTMTADCSKEETNEEVRRLVNETRDAKKGFFISAADATSEAECDALRETIEEGKAESKLKGLRRFHHHNHNALMEALSRESQSTMKDNLKDSKITCENILDEVKRGTICTIDKKVAQEACLGEGDCLAEENDGQGEKRCQTAIDKLKEAYQGKSMLLETNDSTLLEREKSGKTNSMLDVRIALRKAYTHNKSRTLGTKVELDAKPKVNFVDNIKVKEFIIKAFDPPLHDRLLGATHLEDITTKRKEALKKVFGSDQLIEMETQFKEHPSCSKKAAANTVATDMMTRLGVTSDNIKVAEITVPQPWKASEKLRRFIAKSATDRWLTGNENKRKAMAAVYSEDQVKSMRTAAKVENDPHYKKIIEEIKRGVYSPDPILERKVKEVSKILTEKYKKLYPEGEFSEDQLKTQARRIVSGIQQKEKITHTQGAVARAGSLVGSLGLTVATAVATTAGALAVTALCPPLLPVILACGLAAFFSNAHVGFSCGPSDRRRGLISAMQPSLDKAVLDSKEVALINKAGGPSPEKEEAVRSIIDKVASIDRRSGRDHLPYSRNVQLPLVPHVEVNPRYRIAPVSANASPKAAV